MRRRGCLIFSGAVLGLCLIACVLGYFVGIPRFQDAIKDDVEGAVSTEVSRQFTAASTPSGPGRYVITEQSLTERLRAESDNDNNQDIAVRINPSGLEVALVTENQDITYSGQLVAVDGRLEVQNMTSNNDFIEFLFPPDQVANAIEGGVNNYLGANNLRLTSLEMRDGELILETEAAS